MGVDERRTVARAAIVGGAPEGGVGDDGIGAVDFFEMEVGEAGDQARNVAAGGLHFDRNGNRVLVVLHAENYRQAAVGGGVQRLPEFAFAGGAVAERDVGDFVALELDVLELAVIAFGFLRGVGMLGEIAAGFGASDGLQNLGAGGGRLGDDVEPLVRPSARASGGRRSWGRRPRPRRRAAFRAELRPGRDTARGRDSKDRTSRSRASTPRRQRRPGLRGRRLRSGRRPSAGA